MARFLRVAMALGLPAWALGGCTVFLNFDEEIVDATPEPDGPVPDADPLAPDAPPDPTTLFEPNDLQSAATPIELNTMYGPLAVSPKTDRDFYKFTLDVAKDVVVDCTFLTAQGDLDLRLYDSAMTMVGQSQSVDDNEQITKTMAMANQLPMGDYFIEVYSFQNSQVNLSYGLLVSAP